MIRGAVQASAKVTDTYILAGLKTHPDRLPPTASLKEKKLATEKFQAVRPSVHFPRYTLISAIRRSLTPTMSSPTPLGDASTTTSSPRAPPLAAFPGALQALAAARRPRADRATTTLGTPTPSSTRPTRKRRRATFSSRSAGSSRVRRGRAGAEGRGWDRGRMRTTCLVMCSRRCRSEGRSRGMRTDEAATHRLAPEVANRRPFWSYTAGAAGAVLGYVVANVPGALAGGECFCASACSRLIAASESGVAGNRLGAIRDAKGKSVAQVFSQLGGAQKAEVRRREIRRMKLGLTTGRLADSSGTGVQGPWLDGILVGRNCGRGRRKKGLAVGPWRRVGPCTGRTKMYAV